MLEKMNLPKINGNGDDPVTRREFNAAMRAIAQDLTQASKEREELQGDVGILKQDVGNLKEEVGSLRRVSESTLEIVKDIDRQFKEWRDIQRRVEKLETEVFQLKIKSKR